jgi:hypothetical protein
MTDTRKILKIFLASPGDLADERRAAKLVVDEINGQFANALGYHVELVGWEDTISGFGRPQSIINGELEQCEFFIGLMWRHWGTPPAHSGPYTSGFEEEFRRSVDRRREQGRPEISMFFKDISAEFLQDPGDGLKKVLAFRQKLIDGKSIYFEKFTDIRELESKIRRCVSSYVIKLQQKEAAELSDQSQTQPTDSGSRQIMETTGSSPETPFSKEGAQFLRELISKTERHSEEEPIEAVEVARFRLLAGVVGNRENDQNALGVHDSNILFAESSNFTLGFREMMGLMGSGLEHYANENAPLWHWYAATDSAGAALLPMFSVAGGTEARRAGALSAMKLISEPLPSEPHLDRKILLGHWLAQDEGRAVKVAGLGYLSEMGMPADLEAIKVELDRNDYQTKSAAIDAIVRINLRASREKAVSSLYELQPASIDHDLLEALFEKSASLNTPILLGGIGHQSADVRRTTVRLLRARRALPSDVAEQLLNDRDAEVRLEALNSLVEGGRPVSETEAKNILVKPAGSGGIGMFQAGSDVAGEAALAQFREQRLRALGDNELEEAVREDSIFDQTARFILVV